MSYIPNSAMPHAREQSEESAGFDWRPYAEEGERLAREAWSQIRARPVEAAAGAAAIVVGLAFRRWRSSRRNRRLAIA